MPDRQPRYALSQRAADALRPLIQAGTRLGSRPREVRDVELTTARLLRLRRRDDNGTTKIDILLPEDLKSRVVYFGTTSADPLAGGIGTDLDHVWREIGTLPASGAYHVWLLARPPEFDEGAVSIGTPPKYSIALTSSGNKPADPANKPCYGVRLGSWIVVRHIRRYVECHTGSLAFPGTFWFQATSLLSVSGSTLSWYETVHGYDGLNLNKIAEQQISKTIST